MTEKSKTFCVLPWMHLATNASGSLRVCCNSIPDLNYITKEDGKPYKIHRDNVKESWNSEVYKTIRQQMLSGESPEMCTRCFREEDSGLQSARQVWNEKYFESDREYQIVSDFDIRYVDIRLGNLCNLVCRMCNPYSSNQWVEEWHLINQQLDKSEKSRLSKMDWPEHEKTWDNLFSIVESVEEIYLTGGEPTVIKAQHNLLDYCISSGTAGDIKLKYNTNLTNIPNHLLDKWKHFKKIQLNCSIDAVGDLDHYIRYPSNWKKIKQNWERILTFENISPEIHCTVQMYNILHLDKLIEWALPYDVKIYFNILNHPRELNIRNLPRQLKKLAEDRLQKYLEVPKVAGIIDYMNAEDWLHINEFVRYTRNLDLSRNENIIDVVPEFEDLMNV